LIKTIFACFCEIMQSLVDDAKNKDKASPSPAASAVQLANRRPINSQTSFDRAIPTVEVTVKRIPYLSGSEEDHLDHAGNIAHYVLQMPWTVRGLTRSVRNRASECCSFFEAPEGNNAGRVDEP
jgi:hypothetical protein